MRWAIAAVVGVAITVGVAWWLVGRTARLPPGPTVELARRELPGAASLFPTGTLWVQRVEYADGELDAKRSDLRAQLDWHTGEMPPAEDLERLVVEPLKKMGNTSRVERSDAVAGGAPATHLILRGDQVEMAFSIWPCGKRYFTLSIVAALGAAVPLERRIRESFECRPDMARDGQRRVIPLQMDLGPDFGVAEDNPFTFFSLDGQMVYVSPHTSAQPPDDAGRVKAFSNTMEGVAARAGMTGVSFEAVTITRGDSIHKVWRAIGDMGGERTRMLATFIDCGAEKFFTFHVGSLEQPESSAVDLLLRTRCAKNPKSPSPIAIVAREACGRGDRRGCAFEKQRPH